MKTNTTIIDIEETCHGKNIIVTCCMEAPEVKKNINVCLDAVKMGIDTKDEFEMELSKDFIREVENFHSRNKRLPAFYDLNPHCSYSLRKSLIFSRRFFLRRF